MDLLARSRAVVHAPAPGAQVQPWIGASIVGALGSVNRIHAGLACHPNSCHRASPRAPGVSPCSRSFELLLGGTSPQGFGCAHWAREFAQHGRVPRTLPVMADRLRDVRYLHTCGERLGLSDEVSVARRPKAWQCHAAARVGLRVLHSCASLTATHAVTDAPGHTHAQRRSLKRQRGATTACTERLCPERSTRLCLASLSSTLRPSALTHPVTSGTASRSESQWRTLLNRPRFPSMRSEATAFGQPAMHGSSIGKHACCQFSIVAPAAVFRH